MQKFLSDFKKKKPSISIIYSNTPHIYEKVFEEIEFILKKELPEAEIITLNGLDVKHTAFHAELSTITMFGSGRLLKLKHADTMLKDIIQDETVYAYFQRDFLNLPENTSLLIHIEKNKLPAKLKFLEKDALIFNEPKFNEKDLISYLSHRAEQMGYQTEPGSLQLLADKSSWQHKEALQGLDRLFTYALAEKKIYKSDVEEVCYDMDGNLFYILIDDISQRKIAKSINTLLKHRIQDGNILLGAWIKLFSESMRAYYLNKCQYGINDIHKRLGLNTNHQYAIKKNQERMNSVIRHYGILSIKKILKKLLILDKNLKENNHIELQKTLMVYFLNSLLDI